MKKLTQNEINAFIDGTGLVEILPDLSDADRVFNFLKKRGGFISTRDTTYKVTEETYTLLITMGFKIQNIP
ncbi:MAG TPA: hypothetical protein VII00_04755 [bacterium]